MNGKHAMESRIKPEGPLDSAGEQRPERDGKGRLAPGNEHRFSPGQSGNRRGRPRDRVTAEMRQLLDEHPELARSLALRLFKHFKDGKAAAVKEVMNRLEGRVPLLRVDEADAERESEFELRVVVVGADGPPLPTDLYTPRVPPPEVVTVEPDAPESRVLPAPPRALLPEPQRLPQPEPDPCSGCLGSGVVGRGSLDAPLIPCPLCRLQI